MYDPRVEQQPAPVSEFNPTAGIRGPLLGIVFACAGLISYWGNTAIAPQLAILSQLVVCLLGVLILGSMFTQRTPVLFSLECLLIAAFFGWSLFGYVFSALPERALEGLVTLFKLLLMALAVANAVNGRRAYLWFLVGVMAAAVVATLAGASGLARGSEEMMGRARMQGAFGNPNGLSKLACLCVWAAASFLFSSRHHLTRMAMIALIVFCVAIIGLTGSRQAMIGLFLMIGAAWWFVLRRTSTRLAAKAAWLMVIGLVLGGAVLFMSTTTHWKRMEVVLKGGIQSETSMSARASFMRTSFDTVMRKPLFGVGYDCVGFYIGGYKLRSPHNTILGVAANTGIPGWLFFFGAWGVGSWRLHRVSRLPLPQVDRTLVLSIWLLQACLVLWSATTTLLSYKPFWVAFPVCLGYLVWLERTYGPEGTARQAAPDGYQHPAAEVPSGDRSPRL